jgi:hypothetical protein
LFDRPYIIALDPLNLNKTAISQDILAYLKKEAIEKLNISESDFQEPELITSDCPRQKNFTDCGVYCLHYIKNLYKYPNYMMDILHVSNHSTSIVYILTTMLYSVMPGRTMLGIETEHCQDFDCICDAC